jgi:hypothetical protein
MSFRTDWITGRQAMDILQITSRTTLYRFVYKNNIRVSKPLGRTYYSLNDILAAIEKKSFKMGI